MLLTNCYKIFQQKCLFCLAFCSLQSPPQHCALSAIYNNAPLQPILGKKLCSQMNSVPLPPLVVHITLPEPGQWPKSPVLQLQSRNQSPLPPCTVCLFSSLASKAIGLLLVGLGWYLFKDCCKHVWLLNRNPQQPFSSSGDYDFHSRETIWLDI